MKLPQFCFQNCKKQGPISLVCSVTFPQRKPCVCHTEKQALHNRSVKSSCSDDGTRGGAFGLPEDWNISTLGPQWWHLNSLSRNLYFTFTGNSKLKTSMQLFKKYMW